MISPIHRDAMTDMLAEGKLTLSTESRSVNQPRVFADFMSVNMTEDGHYTLVFA